MNSARIRLFKLDYEKVINELKEYANRVISRGAVAVILVGSLARGDYTAFSDADVIVIANNVPSNPMERLKDFMDSSLSVDLQPRVFTVKEFFKMAKDRRRIIGEVVKYGILLAGDRGIIEKVRKEFLGG